MYICTNVITHNMYAFVFFWEEEKKKSGEKVERFINIL